MLYNGYSMRISNETMKKVLVRSGVATEEQFETLREEAEKLTIPIQELAEQKGIINDETLAQAYAAYSGTPYIELDPSKIPFETLSIIPEQTAQQYKAVLFQIDEDGTPHLAIDDPDDIVAINFIEKALGRPAKIYIASTSNIQSALGVYRSNVDKELEDVIETQREKDGARVEVDEEIDENSPIAKTINLLLEYAIRSNASDIHIEPREEFIQVRYRIDGVLKEVNRLPKNVMHPLVSRVKILSNLKIDERRVPQDGRFKVNVGGKRYALRVSTLPVSDGEKIVIRILDESNQAVSLKELGYWGKTLRDTLSAMAEPDGMVLVTGPTGSGKSTSLFSMLTMINSPELNISTIEDPVEYKIPGVNQTQTNPKAGMTFATGLRSLLRQDPNVIMVGEIRDSETAGLGVQAALTGHLVFSTLHTNNAATSLPRLLDMGIEPFLIASTVKLAIGQRLVRRINPETRIAYTPTEQEIISILTSLGFSQEDMGKIHELEKKAKADGIGEDVPLSSNGSTITTLYKTDENDNDGGSISGYRGRRGIYEAFVNDSSIQKLITANATSEEIHNQALENGMVSMTMDGFIKCLRGETTIEELMRVVRN